MRHARGPFAAALLLVISLAGAAPAAAAPEGQMTWAVHVSLAPTWFDPAETSGIINVYGARLNADRGGNHVGDQAEGAASLAPRQPP